jgi:HlyD family secretion protein
MIEQVRAAQAYAEAELARARNAGGAVTKSELENAEYEYRRASEEQRSTRIQEEIAQFELEQAQAALLRTRPRDNEADDSATNGNGGWTFTIYSPINGQVLRVLQESAAVVTAGTPLLELGNPRDLEAEIDVLSRDAVKIRPGAKVWFEHWGGDRDLQGRVRLVEPSGFTKISTLGVEEQRVNVIVDLVDPPEDRTMLGDGFRVEARIVIDEADDVLKVPTSALFRVGKESAVFMVVDNVVHQQVVKIDRQNGLEAEVLAGLAAGDEVVIHPSDQVEDGVHVRQR